MTGKRKIINSNHVSDKQLVSETDDDEDDDDDNSNNNNNNNNNNNCICIQQFYLQTALCPWPSKLLAPLIMKAWLSLISLATALHKLLETAGTLHSSANAYLLPFSALMHLLFMALLALTSSKTSHPRTMLSLIF